MIQTQLLSLSLSLAWDNVTSGSAVRSRSPLFKQFPCSHLRTQVAFRSESRFKRHPLSFPGTDRTHLPPRGSFSGNRPLPGRRTLR